MRKIYAPLYLLLALVAGCAMFQGSPDLTIEAINSTADGVKATTAQAINAGELSTADGEFVLNLTDNTARALDAAQVAADADDLDTARGRIELASRILDEIEAYLLERGVNPNGNK